MPLQAVQLGRTGLTAPRLGAGGHFTDGPTGHRDRARRLAELDHMIDRGLRYFDVQWEPEEDVFAEMIKRRGDEMVVAWPLHGVTAQGDAVTAQYVVDYCADHQQRYGLEHVDILLWIALELDPATEERVVAEAYEGFQRVRASGFCDHFGFSCHHSPEMARRAVDCFDVFEVMMIPYGFYNPAGAGVLRAAKARNMGVAAMKNFGGGFGMMNQIYAGAVETPTLAKWRGDGRPYHAALRWVLRNDSVDCVVPGLHSHAEVDEYIAAAEKPYDAEDEAILREIAAATADLPQNDFLAAWRS